MPVIGIVVSAIGSQVGIALLGETIGSAMLAGAIGSGIAGGLYSSAMGGSFGKGFLTGAVGYGIGQGIQGLMSGPGVTSADMMSNQMEGFNSYGDASGSLGWGDSIGSEGTAGFGTSTPQSTGMGEYFSPDDRFTSVGSAANPSIIGNDSPYFTTNSYSPENISSVELPNPSDIDYGMPDANSMFSTNTDFTSGQYADWMDAVGTNTTLDNSFAGMGADGVVQGPGVVLSPAATQVPQSLGDITANTSGPTLDNVNTTPTQTTSTPVAASTQPSGPGFMDKLKGLVSNSDKYLNDTFGLPKGSTMMGTLGLGSYLMGEYQTYKAEQIAKGMKPMTLEQYRSANADPNKWKIAANEMAKSGRTGALPVLTARMNQQATGDYYNKYLPQTQPNWWNANAQVSQMKQNNLGNLVSPLFMNMAMSKGFNPYGSKK